VPAPDDDDEAPRLFTRRLELIAATAELARALATAPGELAALLGGVELPRDWPPVALRAAHEATAAALATTPGLAGWRDWLVVQQTPATLVGAIGFAGRPDAGGAVEIGGELLGSFQRRGYAAEAMGALIDWAFSHPEVRCIRAHAPADRAASLRLLEKSGLRHVGAGDQPGQLRFELTRPD